MKATWFENEKAQDIFDNLNREYRIIAPTKKCGASRFSDSDIITYDEVKGFNEIDFFNQTFFSAKHVLFPTRETMFTHSPRKRGSGSIEDKPQPLSQSIGELTIKDGKIEEPEEEIFPTIIFLRPCDIHAVKVLDAHFLKDSNNEDFYYKRRRDKIKIFLIECNEGFENCRCVSLGTNTTEDYAVFIRKLDNGYEVLIRDDVFDKFFPFEKKEGIEAPRFVKENISPVKIPENIDASIFGDDIWKEYTARCIACGRCNTSCPTCTCFTVQGVFSKEEGMYQRKRIWSACHVKRFGHLAGNHDFRVKEGDRMRYKTLHKIVDFKKRHGFPMCVGCGRCDNVCPEYISMFKCIDKMVKNE